MQNPLVRQCRQRLYVFLAFALALCVLTVTKSLPYASSLMASTDTDAMGSDPGRGFSIGSVRWDVEQFSSAPVLAPFRRYFIEKCSAQTGVGAAMCLAEGFDRAFHAGTPKHEFLERRFDPVADFEAHLSGEPGHCLSRSGMLATTLLSVGIPARVASFTPRSGWGGHTLVEVWAGADWVAVDPTEVGLVGSIRPSSAARMKHTSGSLRLFNADGSVRQDHYPLSPSVESGELVYPEPWLYARSGPKFSFWPFRGKFIQVGTYGWRFSTPLLLCRLVFVICMLAGLYFLCSLLFSRRKINKIKKIESMLSRKPELVRKAS
jgi:Transglutaminase-like superfamily